MRRKNRKSIAREKLPQFTTMHVIDGQAGLVFYSSLIFYSLTINNILNIIVLLILAGVSISILIGDNGIITQAQKASYQTTVAMAIENVEMAYSSLYADYLVDTQKNSGITKNSYFTKDNLNKYMSGGKIAELVNDGDNSLRIRYQPDESYSSFVLMINENGSASVTTKYGQKIKTEIYTIGNEISIPDNWLYFYEDNENIYLIYGDYLTYTAIPDGENVGTVGFKMFGNGDRNSILNYLSDNSYFDVSSNSYIGTWKDFAKAFNEKYNVTSIQAIGCPTLTMWIDSYNENYGTKLGYKEMTSTSVSYTSKTTTFPGSTGYVLARNLDDISDTTKTGEENDWVYNLPGGGFMNGLEGFTSESKLYYPHHEVVNECYGYWIATASAKNVANVFDATYTGAVTMSHFSDKHYAIRPIISIKKSDISKTNLGIID